MASKMTAPDTRSMSAGEHCPQCGSVFHECCAPASAGEQAVGFVAKVQPGDTISLDATYVCPKCDADTGYRVFPQAQLDVEQQLAAARAKIDQLKETQRKFGGLQHDLFCQIEARDKLIDTLAQALRAWKASSSDPGKEGENRQDAVLQREHALTAYEKLKENG